MSSPGIGMFYRIRRIVLLAAFFALVPALCTSAGWSQSRPNPPKEGGQEPSPAEAGGPQGDIGPLAVPKKKDEAPPPPPKAKAPEGMPTFSISVDVPLVTVPVSVTTKDGQFIPGLKKENFRLMEDGVPQNISAVTQAEAPITAVLVVEFAANSYAFMYDALNASYAFANSLKKDDWVAVVSFDIRPKIVVDFTQDKGAVQAGLNTLRIPGFNEVNVNDALYDTLDRVAGVEGRKYIILVTSGCDTFSRTNFDKLMKKVKQSQNTIVYPISTGKAMLVWLGANGQGVEPGLFPCSTEMDFAQADARLKSIAKTTGGRWFGPRFEAEMPEIFGSIAAEIRNEYVITYRPTNTKQDGSYRKLKVDLVAPDGKPIVVKDQKGKDVKYIVFAREGYTAKNAVE
jgi:VWFA-related protein